MGVDEGRVLDALRKVVDPDLKKDIVSLNFVRDLKIEGGKVSFTLVLTTPACPFQDVLVSQARKAVESLSGVSKVDIRVKYETARTTPTEIYASWKIKNIIAVGSAKGGVGKSTVAVNLAVALAMTGAKVGLLDADVYGASVPNMIGSLSPPDVVDERRIKPAEVAGIKVMSIGLFVPSGTPVIWRGPLVSKAIQEFANNVEWGELDYMIVDLPPGTGDAPLTVAQSMKLSGFILVTTPQRISVDIAIKSIAMFRKLEVNIIGIIENMSYLICPYCGKEIDIFGKGSIEKTARQLDVPFLGSIPIDPRLREAGDKGELLVDFQDSPSAKAIMSIAKRVAARVSTLAFEMASMRREGGTKASLPMPRKESEG